MFAGSIPAFVVVALHLPFEPPVCQLLLADPVLQVFRALGAATVSDMENFYRVPAEIIEIFGPLTKFCRQNDHRFGVQKRTPKWRPLMQSQFDLQVSGRLQRSQNGARFVDKIFAAGRKIVQISIVSAGIRLKFCILLGFHGLAAPRAIVLHTLRMFMSTHVLELLCAKSNHKGWPG